jgi:hydroxymethylbilane synthase
VATQLGVPSREVVIETRGDVDTSPVLAGRLEKGFFTEELERALKAHDVDVAVHSLKDLPTTQPPGLRLGAILKRADPRDWLLINKDAFDASRELPIRAGARVGASSLRRMALLRHHAPWAKSVPLRGNVPTRLSKLGKGEEYDAIVLAAAGVRRLELDLSPFHVIALNPQVWVPAPGQGAIGLQCRDNDPATLAALRHIDDEVTHRQVDTERTLLKAFEGGCSSPFGAYLVGSTLHAGLEQAGRWVLFQLELPAEGLTLAHAQRLLAQLPVVHAQGSLTEDLSFLSTPMAPAPIQR